jgi:hypothetical protein
MFRRGASDLGWQRDGRAVDVVGMMPSGAGWRRAAAVGTSVVVASRRCRWRPLWRAPSGIASSPSPLREPTPGRPRRVVLIGELPRPGSPGTLGGARLCSAGRQVRAPTAQRSTAQRVLSVGEELVWAGQAGHHSGSLASWLVNIATLGHCQCASRTAGWLGCHGPSFSFERPSECVSEA